MSYPSFQSKPIPGFIESPCYILWGFFLEFGFGIATPIGVLATAGSMTANFVGAWAMKEDTNHKKNPKLWALVLIPAFLCVMGYFLIQKYGRSCFPEPPAPADDEENAATAEQLAGEAVAAANDAVTSITAADREAVASNLRADTVVAQVLDTVNETSGSDSLLGLANQAAGIANQATVIVRSLINSAESSMKQVKGLKMAAEAHQTAAATAKTAAEATAKSVSDVRDAQVAAATAVDREARREATLRLQREEAARVPQEEGANRLGEQDGDQAP